MSVSQADIDHVVENSLFSLPTVPDQWERLDLDGVDARFAPQSSFLLANVIGHVRLDDQRADAVVAAAHGFFSERGLPYMWFVADRATPADIGERLLRAGLTRFGEFAGMVLTDLQQQRPVAAQLKVTVASAADMQTVADIYTRAYPVPNDFVDILTKPTIAAGGRHYLGWLAGHDHPVAASSMFIPEGYPVAVLQGAATLAEYRNQGLYTAMVNRRLADAHADGALAAVLQADRATSAAICEKLGFRETMAFAGYGWFGP